MQWGPLACREWLVTSSYITSQTVRANWTAQSTNNGVRDSGVILVSVVGCASSEVAEAESEKSGRHGEWISTGPIIPHIYTWSGTAEASPT